MSTTPPTMRPRVVIGDSSQSVLAFLQILLEPEFEVTGSETDGDQLLQVATAQRPDAVILDFSLSFLDGLAVARRLSEAVPQSKVIFFTSHEDHACIEAAFDVGAVGYLVKPYTVDLGHYVGRVLRGERVSCPEYAPPPVTRRKKP